MISMNIQYEQEFELHIKAKILVKSLLTGELSNLLPHSDLASHVEIHFSGEQNSCPNPQMPYLLQQPSLHGRDFEQVASEAAKARKAARFAKISTVMPFRVFMVCSTARPLKQQEGSQLSSLNTSSSSTLPKVNWNHQL